MPFPVPLPRPVPGPCPSPRPPPSPPPAPGTPLVASEPAATAAVAASRSGCDAAASGEDGFPFVSIRCAAVFLRASSRPVWRQLSWRDEAAAARASARPRPAAPARPPARPPLANRHRAPFRTPRSRATRRAAAERRCRRAVADPAEPGLGPRAAPARDPGRRTPPRPLACPSSPSRPVAAFESPASRAEEIAAGARLGTDIRLLPRERPPAAAGFTGSIDQAGLLARGSRLPRPFPSRSPGTVAPAGSSPLTVAGQRGFLTPLPFSSLRGT